MLDTMPLRSPRHGTVPTPRIVMPSPSTSPTTADTLVVPMSSPTTISDSFSISPPASTERRNRPKKPQREKREDQRIRRREGRVFVGDLSLGLATPEAPGVLPRRGSRHTRKILLTF